MLRSSLLVDVLKSQDTTRTMPELKRLRPQGLLPREPLAGLMQAINGARTGADGDDGGTGDP
jgi:hypothetical protein